MSRLRLIIGGLAAMALVASILLAVTAQNAVGAAGLGAGGVLLGIACLALRRADEDARAETDDIEAMESMRRDELLRGTSLFLREARSRVSIRPTRQDVIAFAADVNGVHLGFVPAIVCDQATDTEEEGYIAFVHDGRRWRGPGLPCPGSRADAIARAERCVSPVEQNPGSV